jgi:hypothetical protein
MVAFFPSEPWPNAVDLVATITFLALVIALPLAGYVFMVLDIRAHLRSLRRGLILVARSFAGIPAWTRRETPRCVMALGLMLPCTEEDLKHAYRERVKQLHPDHGGDQRRFLILQAQFEEALAFVTGRADADTAACPGRSAA